MQLSVVCFAGYNIIVQKFFFIHMTHCCNMPLCIIHVILIIHVHRHDGSCTCHIIIAQSFSHNGRCQCRCINSGSKNVQFSQRSHLVVSIIKFSCLFIMQPCIIIKISRFCDKIEMPRPDKQILFAAVMDIAMIKTLMIHESPSLRSLLAF